MLRTSNAVQAFDNFDLIYFSFDSRVDKMKAISVPELITKLFSIMLTYTSLPGSKAMREANKPITS